VLESVAWYVATGVVAGTLAGLLGVGGGLVIVPTLLWIFAGRGFEAGAVIPAQLGGTADAPQRNHPAEFRHFVESITPPRAAGPPDLHFLHSVMPHRPWQYLPSGNVYAQYEQYDVEKGFLGGYAIVAAHLPVAVGLGMASNIKKENFVTLCIFGDGSVGEGEFHEALNLAVLWKTPVVSAARIDS